MDTARVFIARNRLNLAFGLGGFASAILGTLFGLFNVILFTNVVKLRPSYFYTGHILYGLWNAVNDPAFGWLLDRTANKSNRRLPVIYIGGPAWCLCFMLTWYPWSYDGDSYLAFSHFLFTMFCCSSVLLSGDIILFKCSDTWNSITRLTLSARFDHVAIVVQNTHGMLKLLEST